MEEDVMNKICWLSALISVGLACGSSNNLTTDAAAPNRETDAAPDVTGPGGTNDGGAADEGSMGTSDASVSDLAGAAGEVNPGSWSVPLEHPRIYLNQAQKARLSALVSSANSAAKAFMSTATNAYAYEAWFSALKYQLTGTASHCSYAVSTIDAMVSDEEARIAAGTAAEVAGDSYLYVGGIIGDLALTLDYCWDSITTAQRARWLAYANQAVWNVWNPTLAKWGSKTFPWSGWSIDNPSNNYYFSFLKATMLLGLVEYYEDPSNGPAFAKMFRDTKIQGQLVPTFLSDLAGGGSREGTGYGVSMRDLFRLYDQWEQTTGQRIADLTSHARESMAFLLHEILPTYDRVAPTGDHARESTGALFDYNRDYANVLAWLYPSDPMAARLAWVLDASSVPTMGQAFMRFSDFLYTNPALTKVPPDDVYPAYRAAGTGNLFLRSGWSKDATWAHFMCGPYTESHAHQDQGSFLIYKRGWLAYDQNINSHSGIVQETTVHNLVRIDQGTTPVAQRVGGKSSSQLLALQDEPDWTYLAADLTPVYEGRTAIVKSQREMVWLKPDVFVIFDRVDTSSGVSRTWQLNSPASPTISGRTATVSASGSTLTVHAILPLASALRVADWKTDSDMLGGFRFEAVDSAGTSSLFLHVVSLDAAVATVVGDDIAGQHGVKLGLKDGGTATVRFGDATPGATVEWTRANGTQVTSGPRTLAVETLPLLK
jgi:hypothetical protein